MSEIKAYQRMVNNLSIKLRRDLQEIAKRYGYDIQMGTPDVISVEVPPPKQPIVVNALQEVHLIREVEPSREIEEPEIDKPEEVTETPVKKKRKPPLRKKLPQVESEELEPDMIIFAQRIAEKLASTEGLPPDGVERALKVQKEIENDLRDVFIDKKDYNQWFDRTKTQFGLHPYKFTTILMECLEGLQSVDAQALRSDYQQSLSRLGM